MPSLGEAIFLDKKNYIEIQDEVEYRIAGVQSYGKGIVIRRTVKGSELTMKKYQVIKKNQLMWCKVDTKNGAFGITHDEHVGALASTNMALAGINNIDYLPEFIETLFQLKPFYDWITKYSSGSTNRKYLTPQQLMERVDIPSLSLIQQKAFQNKVDSLKSSEFYSEIEHRKVLLKKLRQQILQDAIEGKLTKDWREQNPDVEPASKLLKRIQAEKQQMIKDKKIKKQKPLPAITDDEKPFELPESWKWCKLGKVSNFISGKNFSSSDFKKNNGAKCVKITNAGVQKVIETDDCLPIDYIEKYSKYLIFQEDIIIALTRPYIADGLKVSLCPESYNKSLLNQRVAVIRTFHKALVNEYAYLFLRTDYVLDGYKSEFESKGQQPNLKKEHITHLNIPIPPFEEQKEIIKKVENLFAICDQLEEQITSSQTNAEQLMQSVLKEAFAQDDKAA